MAPLVDSVEYRAGLHVKTHVPVEMRLRASPMLAKRLVQTKPKQLPRERPMGPIRPQADLDLPDTDMLKGRPSKKDLNELWDYFTNDAEERLLCIFDKKPGAKANVGRGQTQKLEMQSAVIKKDTTWRGASEFVWACRMQADTACELHKQLKMGD